MLRFMYRFVIFLLALVFGFSPCFAKNTVKGLVDAEVLEVVDGDTVKVRANIWFNQWLDTSVRIYGVDTPEMKGKCEQERALARQAKDFISRTIPAGTNIFLYDVEKDKYGGRVVAKIKAEGYEDLGAALIKEGLAYPYYGKTKHSWCGDTTQKTK